MSTFVNKKLHTPVQLSSGSVTTLYTVPSGRSVILTSLSIANNGEDISHVTYYLCNAGDTANDDNIFLPGVEVNAHTLVNIGVGQVLEVGDVLRALVDTDAVSVHTSGILIV